MRCVVLVAVFTLPKLVFSDLALHRQTVFARFLKFFDALLLKTSRGHRSTGHVNFVKIPVALERVIAVDVFIGVDELDHPPPEASDLVGDDESDQNESNYFVGVHGDLLRLDSVSSGRLVIVILDKPLDLGNIE